MTPKEAHQLLVNATALLQLNRADHNKVLEALTVLEPKDAEKTAGVAAQK